jgi:cytidylate kinase
MDRDSHLIDLCRGYMDAQTLFADKRRATFHTQVQQPAITISRETGAGAVSIGRILAERLSKGREDQWALFDKNLVEKVIEDHEMPGMMKKFLSEDTRSAISSAIEEFFGLHPSEWTLVERTSETILHLAKLGNAIIIGRGGSIITGGLRHVVHVRLVAPVEWRIRHSMDFFHVSRAEAEKMVQEKDAGRARYVHKHFHARIDDPLHYHLTINTGKVSFESAAEAILECVKAIKPEMVPVS